ncbi:PWWP domain-containing protein [Drosera capensis]
MKRDGHALVAFFGDSSYGWFEAAELIPYEPNYAAKWQQTSSRNFVKAVEESEDEVSRRAALGLSCRCRNPYNFRPASMQGYFSVDVLDYEPGGVYSAGQIYKAREGFQPCAMLSFVKQLALAPNDVERKTINFIRSKSTSLAYRRAIFEEFDETYAQAFGQQPVRPSRLSPRAIDQSVRDKEAFDGVFDHADLLDQAEQLGFVLIWCFCFHLPFASISWCWLE